MGARSGPRRGLDAVRVSIVARLSEAHPICAIPKCVEIPEALAEWAQRMSRDHEAEWGFEEDVGVMHPLCAWRGSVGAHKDFDFARDEVIFGVILTTSGQYLEATGAVPRLLLPGTLYLLEPSIEHGTSALDSDDLFTFLTDSTGRDDWRTPHDMATALLTKGMEMMARHPVFENHALPPLPIERPMP